MSENKLDRMIDDAELDIMLTEWAEAEIELPEGFHDAVMARLREETEKQTSPKKGVIVSLTERFGNKKAWMSAVAAATLVLCCLPVLHNSRDTVSGVNNYAVQAYEMKSRTIDTDDHTGASDGTDHSITMTAMLADTEQAATPAYNINGAVEKTEAPVQATYDTAYEYVNAESREELPLEEQLAMLQDELIALESQLAALAENDTAQRTALETEIGELQAQIEQVEEQIAAEETIPAE